MQDVLYQFVCVFQCVCRLDTAENNGKKYNLVGTIIIIH